MGDGDTKTSFAALAQYPDSQEKSKNSVIHAPIPTPAVDDMEPQNISFIGNSDDTYGISKLNISSGTRTYRIPSPTRPHISRSSFQPGGDLSAADLPDADSSANEKGFYISFDNEQPKKPKPPLRLKRGSPKKEKTGMPASNIDNATTIQPQKLNQERVARERHKLEEDKRQVDVAEERQKVLNVDSGRAMLAQNNEEKEGGTALVIGTDLKNLDPVS